MQTRYEHVKRRYRNSAVATTYDSSRFLSAKGQKRNRLMLAAIQRAFDKAASLGTPIRDCLDLPCGTGRLFPWLLQRRLRFVGADISLEMMLAGRTSSAPRAAAGFPSGSSNVTASTSPSRIGRLKPSFPFVSCSTCPARARQNSAGDGRVSRRWLIVDFRHCYNVRWCFRRLCLWPGLANHREKYGHG